MEVLKELQSKYPTQYKAFLKEKSLDWITNNIKYQDNIINGMACLYYYHYLESSIGKNEWQKGKSTDAKVDRIYDSIINTYVDSDRRIISFI